MTDVSRQECIIGTSRTIRGIAKHKRTESSPSPKCEQLALFVEQVPASIAMFDTEMRYLAASRRFLSDLKLLFSAELFTAAVIGHSHYELFPDMPRRWRDSYARVLTGEELALEEDFLPRQNGRINCVRWSMKPWHTAEGRIGGALLFSELITEQVEARHSLAESEARFRATFENAAVGIAHLDSDLRWLRANGAFCRIVGWPLNELVTKSLRDISHPDELADEFAHIEQMLQGKIDSYEMDKRYLRKDGVIAWGRLTISCVYKSDGSVDYFVRVVQDISERKRAEELVRRQADLLDQSHDAMFTWKIGGGITYWNRGAEVLYGYAAADAIGRSSHELLQTRANVRIEEIEAQLSRQGTWYGELTHTTRDGREIVVESRSVCVSYDGEMHALETNRDITERKRAEEQLHLLMRESNHRIKNILGLVQAIARQIAARETEEFVDRFTERIQALAANQDLLIKNEWRGVDIQTLVRSQLAHFADFVGSRIVVHGSKLRLSAAAAQAIGLALHELATNAGKYGALSTNNGRVDINWGTDGDTFTMSWVERGGPPVSTPKKRGFGTFVMETMVERSISGKVDFDFAPTGVTWRLTCPAANAVESG
jgi:PAS domain S-box-containing protein